jgi:hypothetical protein
LKKVFVLLALEKLVGLRELEDVLFFVKGVEEVCGLSQSLSSNNISYKRMLLLKNEIFKFSHAKEVLDSLNSKNVS